MLYIAKECITHGQVSYSNIQLQLTLSETYAMRPQGAMGNLLINLPSLAVAHPYTN